MYTRGKTILIVEDDAKIRTLIRIYLKQAGFEVWEAQDGKEAMELFSMLDPCFLIIDLMLPEVNGEEVCHWVRSSQNSDIPIIMVTAKTKEADRIQGLQMGADDYVIKPFSPAELVARVETVLRRTANRCSKISYRGLTLKPIRGEAKYKGELLGLTAHEFQILLVLMQHPNQILTREQLLDYLYPYQEKSVTERTIDVHIRKLREKLSGATEEEFIETVRGMGYRFVAY